MAGLTMNIHLAKRPAIYRPNKYRAHKLGLEEGCEIPVDVHGIFQYTDNDEAEPVAVVEFTDGKCDYAAITEIQFTDTEVPSNADNSD